MSKIDCKVTENFLEEMGRMCTSMKGACNECCISSANNGTKIPCQCFIKEHPENAIALVQKWSDEHPQKTILDDFKEKYPDADAGKIDPCLLGYKTIYKSKSIECWTCIDCTQCWNTPYEEA